jgi:hypothetical protein
MRHALSVTVLRVIFVASTSTLCVPSSSPQAGLAGVSEISTEMQQSAWLAPPPPRFASSTSLHRYPTVVVDPLETSSRITPKDRSPEIDAAFDFEGRLQAAYRVPGYLVIATEPA